MQRWNLNLPALTIAAMLCSSTPTFAGDAGPPLPPDEVQIGLSPEAAKRAERFEQLNVYRRAVAGDAAARAEWDARKPEPRHALLSELAVTKEGSAARQQALLDLARLSTSEDATGQGLVAIARVAVADGDGSMRDLARKALIVRNDDRTPKLLASVLRADDALMRANAVAAMKAIGGPRLFEVIIEHWKEVWGAGPRNHMVVGAQRSYVADYDISGDSYDPVVRRFITGVVLDTKVLKVESDVYYVTIREVTPFDVNLPNNPAAWQKWLRQERPKLVQDAAKKRAVATAALHGRDEE